MGDNFKNDDGKLDYTLIAPRFLEDVVKVREFGIKKYGGDVDGWRNVDIERYEKAMLRHLIAWWSGEELDRESGLPHMAHVVCNHMFIEESKKHGNQL